MLEWRDLDQEKEKYASHNDNSKTILVPGAGRVGPQHSRAAVV